MSEVNYTKFLVQHELCERKCELNESVCNSKQKWSHNKCRCEFKEFDDWGSCKNSCIWNPSKCDCECNKACKIDEYLNIKNFSCKKRLIGKLVLEYEDEILDTTKTLLNDKKVACAKINCLIHTISCVTICFLLLVLICVRCYFFYKI